MVPASPANAIRTTAQAGATQDTLTSKPSSVYAHRRHHPSRLPTSPSFSLHQPPLTRRIRRPPDSQSDSDHRRTPDCRNSIPPPLPPAPAPLSSIFFQTVIRTRTLQCLILPLGPGFLHPTTTTTTPLTRLLIRSIARCRTSHRRRRRPLSTSSRRGRPCPMDQTRTRRSLPPKFRGRESRGHVRTAVPEGRSASRRTHVRRVAMLDSRIVLSVSEHGPPGTLDSPFLWTRSSYCRELTSKQSPSLSAGFFRTDRRLNVSAPHQISRLRR